MMTTEPLKYRYRVNAADVLVWVDATWLAFARENGADELTEESVLGRSLWEFVGGEDLRRLYMEIHSRVRMSDSPMVFPFRCDSPSLQRNMRAKITPDDTGHLTYENVVVSAAPQRCLSMLEREQPRSNSFLTLCSCCKRALLDPIGWLDLEDVANRLGLFEARRVPSLRYAICPACAHALQDVADDGNPAKVNT